MVPRPVLVDSSFYIRSLRAGQDPFRPLAVIAEVRRTKPVRSHFTYTQGLAFARPLGVIAAARPVVALRLTFDA